MSVRGRDCLVRSLSLGWLSHGLLVFLIPAFESSSVLRRGLNAISLWEVNLDSERNGEAKIGC